MRTSLWFALALVAVVGLFLPAKGAVAGVKEIGDASSPASRSTQVCPERCNISGPAKGNCTGACSLLGPDVSQTLSSKVPVNKGTTEDLPDVMEPGVMRIPPYSPERISQSWGTSERNSTGIHLLKTLSGRDFCGISTFIDQTSGALPSVEDCLTIVRNIQGDDSSSWQTPVVGKPHRGILEYKSCVFGVEATKVNGNVWFLVGGQDVIDIINESIARFKQNGKVGAMGTMKCMGNLLDQWVEWGLY